MCTDVSSPRSFRCAEIGANHHQVQGKLVAAIASQGPGKIIGLAF